MANDRAIRFCFDYVSPYSYLTWTQIHALAAHHGREVTPVPVLFAALLDSAGTKGPAEVPPKRLYTFKDCMRAAHRLRVPFAPPPSHPFNPLLALRVSSLDLAPLRKRALIDALFAAAWGGGTGIEGPEHVTSVATSAGLDGPELVAQASAADVKNRVRAQTDEAIAKGAFGLPSIFVGEGELFWGLDSFANLEQYLRGDEPDMREALESWRTLEASATRRHPIG